MKKLSPLALSALCSNLARGCEKQYKAEEGFPLLAAKFRLVAAIEKHHEERYRKLLHYVEKKETFQKTEVKIWECRNSGHLIIGTKAPEICPTCGYAQSFFELNCENY